MTVPVGSGPKTDDLPLMANVIRAAYYAAHRDYTSKRSGLPSSAGSTRSPRWDGGTDAMGRNHKPVWPKIAAFVAEHKLDPNRLIRTAFLGAAHGKPPQPNMLYGVKALEAYHNGSGVAEDIDAIYRAQAGEFTEQVDRLTDKGMPTASAVRQVLRDRTLGLSALFRYTAAANVGFADIAREFQNAAQLQYLLNRTSIDAGWGVDIPEELTRAANDASSAALRLKVGSRS